MARNQAGSGGGGGGVGEGRGLGEMRDADGMKPVRPSRQDQKHRAWVEKDLNNGLH